MALKLYLVCLLILSVIDGLWLGFFAKKFYARQLSALMAPRVRWGAAVAFYLLYPAGLLLFVLQPAFFLGSWQYALYQGMFFGVVAYGTYDLTNHATLRGWPTIITIVDIAWGALVSGTAAALTVFVATHWL